MRYFLVFSQEFAALEKRRSLIGDVVRYDEAFVIHGQANVIFDSWQSRFGNGNGTVVFSVEGRQQLPDTHRYGARDDAYVM